MEHWNSLAFHLGPGAASDSPLVETASFGPGASPQPSPGLGCIARPVAPLTRVLARRTANVYWVKGLWPTQDTNASLRGNL
jgi:hypothetical protein